MNHLLFPLWTPQPDMNSIDLEAEFEAMKFRNSIIDACLSGELSPDFVLEVLDAQSIPVEDYVREVSEGIDLLIAS